MKRTAWFLIASAFALAAIVPAPSRAAEGIKVGVVDLQRALNTTREGSKAKEDLKKKHEAKQVQIDEKQKELKAMDEKLKSSVISKDAKASLQKEFDKKKEEFQEFYAQAVTEEKEENQAASQHILDGLIGIAQKIGKEEGYTVVLEKSASGLVWFQDGLDLTERVVKIYDEKPPVREESRKP